MCIIVSGFLYSFGNFVILSALFFFDASRGAVALLDRVRVLLSSSCVDEATRSLLLF